MGGHFDPAFDWTPGMVDMKRWVDGLLDHFRAVRQRAALNPAGDVMLEVERLREDKLRLENLVVACAWCNAVKSDRIGIWPRPLDVIKGMRYAYPSEEN